MNKKGSHVGVVVSFVIFVTFLVFLYTIIQPLTVREREKEYLIDHLIVNLMNSSSETVRYMIVNVPDAVGPQPCLNLQSVINDEEIPDYMVDHLLFKSDEQKFTYQKNDPNIRVNTGNGFLGIITVIYSESITPEDYDGPPGCNPKNYPIGYLKEFSAVFETQLYELNESYYLNYELFKDFLGLPPDYEFNFYVLNAEREIIISAKTYEPPSDRSIYVEEVPLQYMDEEGNTCFGFLKVEIW